jgi:glycine/D-amino acid oxidase-like deaminating enzyme
VSSEADVVVVGGGVIGCAIAYCLSKEKARVVVLERGLVGGEASGAAAGMLAPLAEAHGPSPFLDLCLASHRLFPGAGRHPPSRGRRRRGVRALGPAARRLLGGRGGGVAFAP